ncbi:hypothetical protein NPX13_g7143 [Xylaria arbuscula]|uniref:Uncharacterized protein n=1 Tax=Xylaria arbuscula TaxID=114810 RepID=A0A9W8TKR0_9PEZI|nr:hypothetical protein NPX13_g7143 [Xylaria arbuscula]
MHPSFEGWEKMGNIFKQDILDVDAEGWLVEPIENGIMADGDAERDLEDANAVKEKAGKGKGEGAKKETASSARRSRRSHMINEGV